MSGTPLRDSGLPAVERLPWGSHFCQLYSSREDLVETLPPYFTAGLRQNESCLWVTPAALAAGEAAKLLADAIPDFTAFLEKGQIEIRDASGPDAPGEDSGSDHLLEAWIEREERARRDGYSGLRVAAETVGAIPDEEADADEEGHSTLARRRILALCTCSLQECTAQDVVDAVLTHDFTLARRAGRWERIDGASPRAVTKSSSPSPEDLESQVQERTRELEDALHGRDEFLALLAHELRNPLGPIRSAAHVVRLLSKSDQNLASASDVLERQVTHMSRLVDDLLDTAGITRGSVKLKREVASASALLARALEAARPQISARRHALTLTLPSEELRVHVDPTRIEQVLGNLLDNAARFTPEGGRIEVGASREGNEAVLRVRDTGVGIEPEMLDRVFDLFPQRRTAASRAGGGLGLGLALVKRLVEMHGGSVEARSEGRGQGAELVVRLPLTEAEVSTSPTPARGARQQIGRRVLVVDDNLDACRTLRMSLELLGHQVEVAHDGSGALAAARRRRPEVVLLDIGLPDADGYEVARRLRRLPGLADVRLVALTGFGQPEDRRRGRRAGFDAFFVKPISPEALSEIVGVRTLH